MQRTKHSTSPKRLTAIQTSRHFRVSHHRHTGKMLPRSSTSYPVLAMIVLVVGVLIGGWTHMVNAETNPYGPPQQDSYVVHASVPGPAPTQAATIDNPDNQAHVSDKPLLVNGSCPFDADGTYVSLYRNNFYSGTALCDATGHYQLAIDLFTGANQLLARVFNFTDIAGPDSNQITVYYQPASAASSNASPSTTSQSTARGFSTNAAPSPDVAAPATVPLSLSTDFTIRGYYVGQQSVWQLDLEGGSGPYAIAVDWGDGSNGIVSRGTTGQTRLTHTYQKAGGQQGSYIVKFTATDAAGNQTYLQLLVVVNSRQPSTVGRTSQAGGGAGLSDGSLGLLNHYIWPSYGVSVLMLASFWLGERREFRALQPRLKRPRHV